MTGCLCRTPLSRCRIISEGSSPLDVPLCAWNRRDDRRVSGRVAVGRLVVLVDYGETFCGSARRCFENFAWNCCEDFIDGSEDWLFWDNLIRSPLSFVDL